MKRALSAGLLVAGLIHTGMGSVTNIVISGDVGNGGFQLEDPFSAMNGTNVLEVTTNSVGRRLVSSSVIGAYVEFPGWRATRWYYSGGSGAWGLDGQGLGDLSGWTNTYYFMNSGDATLRSETYSINMASGTVVTVGFDLVAAALYTNAAPACAGEIDFGSGQVFTWSAEAGSISAAMAKTHFTTNFTLFKDAGSVTLALGFTTGRGEGGDANRSANQTLLDNVSLVLVGEEPPPLGNVIIDGDTNNGNMQTEDPFAAYNGAVALTVTTNTTGRRQVSNSVIGAYGEWPGWRMTRTYYSGGNGAWGLDGFTKPDMPGWSNTFVFVNSGDFRIESDNYPVALYKGDSVTVGFELVANDIYTTNSGGLAASCAGEIDLGMGQVFAWTAEEASVVTNQQTLFFSREFVLTNDAAFAALTLYFSTGRGQNGDPNRSANQCRLDNVSLISFSVPEQPSILGYSRVASNLFAIVVSSKDPENQVPLHTTSLGLAPWTAVPHSDNGTNPFVETNLLYSTVDGTERTIYVEGSAAVEFFGIGIQ